MKNKIYATTTIVTVLSVAERFLGFIYRIVLSRLIGAEGLGLYQVSLSLFSLFLTIGTGGIPISVSRMISKSKAENNPYGERTAVSAGLFLSLCLTLPFCLFFGIFGDKFPALFADKRSFRVFRILLIGLSFSSIYAVLRGHCWGNKRFLLPSILEIVEEAVMVIAGIFLLKNVSSPVSGAEKAAWAVVISYLCSFTASTVAFFLCGGKLAKPNVALKPLLRSSAPITSVRASGSLVTSAVAVLLPVMLVRAGFSESESLQLFGVVSGMVLPILFVPSTIIGSLALVLVPELSEDFYRNNRDRLQRNVRRGLKFSLLVACAMLPFFYVLGSDVGRIAYSNAQAGAMISKSGIVLIPMSLTMISTSALNAMGFEKQTFAFYFIGATALIVCILALPVFVGAYAYVVGLGASFSVNAVCNLVFLHKKCSLFDRKDPSIRERGILPAIVAVFPVSFFGKCVSNILKYFVGETFALLGAGLALVAVTLLLYYVFGIFTIRNVKSKLLGEKA
ncbi:MAG: oligosaccharide flippase family protein [Clostridia bacterium]|nr:oligosaccharide flippase family protein [Clostridia bacterium]